MKKSTLKTLARTRTMVAALETKLKKSGTTPADRSKSKAALAPIKALLEQLEQIAQRSTGTPAKKAAAAVSKKKSSGKKSKAGTAQTASRAKSKPARKSAAGKAKSTAKKKPTSRNAKV